MTNRKINPRLIQKAKEWMNKEVPEDEPIKPTSNLENLVDFCETKLERRDKEIIYELYGSIGGNPENKYKEDNQGSIRIMYNRVVYINLNFMDLEQLPEIIGNLEELQILYINENRLTQLPDSIWNLKELQQLHMRGSKLTYLSDRIGDLKKLKMLDVRSNELTQLPNNIGDLKELQTLYVDYNKLTQLPDSIGDLKELQRLHVCHNELTHLPDSIGDLSALRELYISKNKLTRKSKKLCNKLLRKKGLRVLR